MWVQTTKQAEGIGEAAKTGLLNKLSRADKAVSPSKEIWKTIKQKRQAAAYLTKLVGPAKVHATGPRPGLGSVEAKTKAADGCQ